MTVSCVCGWSAEAPTKQAAEYVQEAHWAGHAAAFRDAIEEAVPVSDGGSET